MRTVALIDGDIVAYMAAAANEQRVDFGGDGDPAFDIDEDGARRYALEKVQDIQDAVEADLICLCFSDADNWRMGVDPTYKSNRDPSARPLYLDGLKEWLANHPGIGDETIIYPGLEADDVMGILSTNPEAYPGMRKVIVSEDKDMQTIPGYLYNPNKPERGIARISKLNAARFHHWQAVCGDPTDGYPGAIQKEPDPGKKRRKGIGAKSVYAEEILEANLMELWPLVAMAFAEVGLTEDDAIRQARLARILQYPDWDAARQKPRLWTPETWKGFYGLA